MRRTLAILAALVIVAQPVLAQGRGGGGRGGRGGGAQVPPAPNSWPLTADSASYIRRTPPTDPGIQRIFAEGMERSQVMKLAQQLLDSVGPRLTGSLGMESAQRYLVHTYTSWGIPARIENYGTWAGWTGGTAHADLVFPRMRSLEVHPMGWTEGTGGQWLEGDVVIIPESVNSPEAFNAWIPSTRGKFVLVSAPRLSCRMPRQWQEFGSAESRTRIRQDQDALQQMYSSRMVYANGPAGLSARLKEVGGLGILSFAWSQYPGINKVFGSPRVVVPNVDVGCEDYGLLFRLAQNNQSPRMRLLVQAERLGERPVGNVIAEIRGTQLPNEYVLLSAHFDSFTGGSGATDNGTGSLVMFEAMRILKAAYPNPRRTIIAGHWNGEEQGLNGSRAFVEDNPRIVAGLQAGFNQDNGTGRVTSVSPGPFSNARPVLERYLSAMPSDVTQWIRLGGTSSGPATGGSDHASFQCQKAPAFGLGALQWDYSNTTWHTMRDTYDKVVPEDIRNNATLVAMLVYMASEDPQKMPRDLSPMANDPQTDQPRAWPNCARSIRTSAGSNR
jgi:hypothetical protein